MSKLLDDLNDVAKDLEDEGHQLADKVRKIADRVAKGVEDLFGDIVGEKKDTTTRQIS